VHLHFADFVYPVRGRVLWYGSTASFVVACAVCSYVQRGGCVGSGEIDL